MKNLRDYKRKEIRCLIIEDFATGDILKIKEEKEIEKCLKKYTDNEITKVYNPSPKQIEEINSIIERSSENDKIYSKVDGVDMLIRVIPMLTDIVVDLDKSEDVELINEIISDPNEIFNEVVLELNKIILSINLQWIDNLKLLNKLPDEIINILASETKGSEKIG